MAMRNHEKQQEEYRFRIRFQREGALVYIGHLDFMRTFERALRRAELPLAYSQGYNPRPKIVFALPLGVGIATLDDVLDMSLVNFWDSNMLVRRINQYAPPGLYILSAQEVTEEKGSVMALVSAASYQINAPGISAAIQRIMQKEALIVTKRAKGKKTKLDLRPLIIQVSMLKESEDSVEVLVCAGSKANVRPDLLLIACSEYGSLDLRSAENAEVIRTGLFAGKWPDLFRLSDPMNE